MRILFLILSAALACCAFSDEKPQSPVPAGSLNELYYEAIAEMLHPVEQHAESLELEPQSGPFVFLDIKQMDEEEDLDTNLFRLFEKMYHRVVPVERLRSSSEMTTLTPTDRITGEEGRIVTLEHPVLMHADTAYMKLSEYTGPESGFGGYYVFYRKAEKWMLLEFRIRWVS